jgi:hypothetical protein
MRDSRDDTRASALEMAAIVAGRAANPESRIRLVLDDSCNER